MFSILEKLINGLFVLNNMVEANPQAVELNNIIKNSNNSVYELLSGRGKGIFFPKKGILSQSADAKGKKINATIGIALEEDLTPMRLKPIAKLLKKLNPADVFPYAPSFGKPELREQWKEMIEEKNPSLRAEISTPIVTNALTHGLSILGYLFLNPGDKIILPDKFWGNYNLIFTNTYGAVLDRFKTFEDGKFNTEGLKEKLEGEPGKKIVLLNFPNNPTGYTPLDNEVESIVEIIEESAEAGNQILVIVDDAYFGLIYKNGVYKESIFSKLADLHENVLAVKVDGATKEDYVWGLRVGFLTYGVKGGNKELYTAMEAKTAGAVRANISNVSHLSQSLVLMGFKARNYQKEKRKKYDLLKSRFTEVVNVLNDDRYPKYFRALPFNSGYFMCVELEEGLDGEKVRQMLLDKYSTGVIAFGNILRIAYSAVKKDQIKQLFDNIYHVCDEIKG